MNIELRKRMADVRRYLDEEFEDKPRKWWECKPDDVIPTKDMGGGKNYFPHSPEETIVKYDVKGALISSALFFMISLAFFVIGNYEMDPAVFVQISIFMVIIMIVLVIDLVKEKKFTMVFNRDGFRIGKMTELVPWEYLVASYIRHDDSGENSWHYLLMYYYDEAKDKFEKIEYSVEGLDMSKENIAATIEYWKILNEAAKVLP